MFQSLLARLALFSLPVFLPTPTTITSPPIVDLGYAKYQGFVDPGSNNTHFWGMRYAAPPTGNLRFAAPQLPAKSTSTQLATSHPPRCFQGGEGLAPSTPHRFIQKEWSQVRESEDCLFLDVYVPGKLGSHSDLPVIVWIHGGGYVFGGATGFTGSDVYNGDDLIASGGAVVVVVIQYRLGLFGFLSGERVKKDGALNAGLLDQQKALQWVQKHISIFGGSPDKVTIWGQSAGAGSVLQHVIANGGQTKPPLFHAAITSSTFLPSQYNYNAAIPEKNYNDVVSKSNCSNAVDSLRCLRSVDVAVLEAANIAIGDSGFFGTFTFVPVVDGTFIRARPTELLRQGKVNGDGLYSLSMAFEGNIFVNESIARGLQVDEYAENLFTNLSPRNAWRAAWFYRHLGTPLEQMMSIMGETIFICPTYYLLRAFKGKAFKSEFAIPPADHGNDVVYYFPSSSPDGPPYKNKAFRNAFAESFTNFARSLDPNTPLPFGDPRPWIPWSETKPVEMLFNRTEQFQPVVRTMTTQRDVLDRCRFWESVGSETAQ